MVMLKSKTIDRMCALALIVMLALTAIVWTGKATSGRQKTIDIGYEGLFDQNRVHTIDIEIADWEGFIATATREEYVECALTIDGERLGGVGIRAKGNTSLSSVAGLGGKKYSFKVEFDHFVKGRLFQGLDKLSLNNLIYDPTMMKDYLAYTLMAKMDVPSPLCSYVQITVNGDPWGLYLAVEGVEDSFLERNNLTTGEIYKPDSMSFGGGRGNGRDFDIEAFRIKEDESEGSNSVGDTATGESKTEGDEASGSAEARMPGDFPPVPSGDFAPPEGFDPPEDVERSEGGKKGAGFPGGSFNFGMGSNDVKLFYIDDDPDSYANIFDNAKTKIGKKDKARLIEALRKLNAGEDIENTVFTDEVIRYLAVHDFLQNSDSYTGMMIHNYYLYEEKGQLAIIPWDYNLAFGGMNGSNAASVINSPIDSPVSTGDTSERPLIAWIFEDGEALAQYHEVYERFVSEWIESGWLVSEISRVEEMIRPSVEADENSFYTVDEFDSAVETLQDYCALRAESIHGQLEGTIPSTSAGQSENSDSLIDVGDLDISSMGSMNNGNGKGFQMPGPGNFTPPEMSGNMSQSTMEGFTPPSGFPGNTADSANNKPAGTADDGESAVTATDNNEPGVAADSTETPTGRPGFPEGFSRSQGFNDSQQTDKKGQWLQLGIWAAILWVALIGVTRFRGHNE